MISLLMFGPICSKKKCAADVQQSDIHQLFSMLESCTMVQTHLSLSLSLSAGIDLKRLSLKVSVQLQTNLSNN